MNLTNIVTDRRERARFLKFAVVGTIGAVVDFGTFNLLSSGVGLHHVLASVGSFVAAIVSNFTWNRYWTYPDSRSKPLGRQLAQFTVVNLIGLAIRTPVFALLSGPLERAFTWFEFLPAGFFTPEFLGHNLALAIAVVLVLFWNFYINRYWTYNDVD